MLNWRELLLTTWRLFRLSCRIIFHRKLMFMAIGVLVYYGAMYAFAVWRPNEGFGVSRALNVLVEIPGIALAVYLTMDLVAGERDRNTLETLFSTTSSHYKIWAIRMVGVYVVLAGTLMGMTVVAYFVFAELPVFRGALNAFLPGVFCRGADILLFRSLSKRKCGSDARYGSNGPDAGRLGIHARFTLRALSEYVRPPGGHGRHPVGRPGAAQSRGCTDVIGPAAFYGTSQDGSPERLVSS